MVKRIYMNYQNRSKQSSTTNMSQHIPDPHEMNPFSSNQSFVLYLEPIYNPVLQVYQNIITLNCVPTGPISNMVSHINLPKLSPFQQATPNFDGTNCVFVLLRHPVSMIGSGNSAFKWNGAFMGADDIPSVLSYLQTHGYHIDTNTTTMLQTGSVVVGGVSDKRFSGNRRMIAMVTFHT
jgi:hypothetical protein